jgi:hypothetical protein
MIGFKKVLNMQNAIESHLNQFKIAVIIFYVLCLSTIFIKEIYPPAFAIWMFGYFIIVPYLIYYIWSSTTLIGKNPLLWVLGSMLLSLFGPLFIYNKIKKEMENQNLIVKINSLKL